MPRYVDADFAPIYLNTTACEQIKRMQTEDVVKVVHARWTKNHKCSNCKEFALTSEDAETLYYHTEHCPFCGAMRDGERKEKE